MIYLGIDPGLDGAVAGISTDDWEARVTDTPTFSVKKSKGVKRVFDVNEMKNILESYNPKEEVHVCIEAVHAMPEQGISSAFYFGHGLGLWEGLIVGVGLSFERVSPQRWKKAMLADMPKGKGASLVVAKRLFPSLDLHRVKDHGRSDALLIAEYIRRTHGG